MRCRRPAYTRASPAFWPAEQAPGSPPVAAPCLWSCRGVRRERSAEAVRGAGLRSDPGAYLFVFFKAEDSCCLPLPCTSHVQVNTGLDSGVSMGVVVRSDLDGHGDAELGAKVLHGQELAREQTRERTHGIWKASPAIQTPPIHPGLLGLVMPWDSGLGFKACMLLYRQLAGFIGIARDLSSFDNRCAHFILQSRNVHNSNPNPDRDPGRVVLSKAGLPIIEYTLTKQDEEMVLVGLEKQLRTMRAAGAKVVIPLHESRPWIDDLSVEAFERR